MKTPTVVRTEQDFGNVFRSARRRLLFRAIGTATCVVSICALAIAIGLHRRHLPLHDFPPDDPRCPARMAYIQAGALSTRAWIVSDVFPFDDGYGVLYGLEKEPTATSVRPFCLDRSMVTAREYRACIDVGACQSEEDRIRDCVRDGRCTPEAFGYIADECTNDRDDYPAMCLTLMDARAFCQRHGKRLPSEGEWLAAAGLLVESDADPAFEGPADEVCDRDSPCAVRRFPPNPLGLFDMMRNADEISWPPIKTDPGIPPSAFAYFRKPSRADYSRPQFERRAVSSRTRAGEKESFRCAADPLGP
jgi:formylglycine-generating enzyme required for sulfatase activity